MNNNSSLNTFKAGQLSNRYGPSVRELRGPQRNCKTGSWVSYEGAVGELYLKASEAIGELCGSYRVGYRASWGSYGRAMELDSKQTTPFRQE